MRIPEGGEVKVMAERLHEKLSNKRIFNFEVNSLSRYHKSNGFPGQDYLKPYTLIKQIYARAKKLVFVFEYGGLEFYGVSFLGMEGRWLFHPDRHSGIIMTIGTLKTFKSGQSVEFHTDTLYYDDSRHFSTFEIYNSPQGLQDAFKNIGPDLLSEPVTVEQYRDGLRNKRIINKPICEFLLEQNRFAGVGNYLRSDILYQSKIHPFRAIGSLTDHEIDVLFTSILDRLQTSYKMGGLTLKSYKHPDGTIGQYKPLIYDRKVTDEGYTVESNQDKDKRTVYWVTGIQI